MDKNLLEQEIDDTVADYIFKKVDEHKLALDKTYKKLMETQQTSFVKKTEQLFEHLSGVVAEERESIKEEYSTMLTGKLEEKNAKIAELEESLDTFKEQLAERVNDFLTNSRDELRSVMEEEMRLDAAELQAQGVVEQIRGLVKVDSEIIIEESKGEVERLKNDITILKERIGSQREAKQIFETEIVVRDMIDSVDEDDKTFFTDKLKSSESVEEAKAKFEMLKKAVSESKVERLENQLNETHSRGRGSFKRPEDNTVLQGEQSRDGMLRLQRMAGIDV